jgi:hypothetical protein
VNLREADLLPHLDRWIAELFNPANLDTTCAQLVRLTNNRANSNEVARAHHTIRECDLALRRYRAALERVPLPRRSPSGSTAPPPPRPPPNSAYVSYATTTTWRGTRWSKSATWLG